MHSILYRSLSTGQLYIYDINENPVSKVQMIKYCLWDKQEHFGIKLNNIFMVFILEESFKASESDSYFIKLPCKSFSYYFLELYGHTYEKNKRYGVNAESFNSIEDFFYLQKEKKFMM